MDDHLRARYAALFNLIDASNPSAALIKPLIDAYARDMKTAAGG